MTLKVAHIATIDMTVKVLLLEQLKRLRADGFEVAAISAPGPWVPAIESAGIRHIPWSSATRSWDLRADGRAFAELVSILRRERFSVVHTHNAKPGVMGRIAARMARVPLVLHTCHGFNATLEDPFAKRLAYMGLEWVAARCSDLDLYQSQEDLDRALRIGVATRRASVRLGNGTDLTKFDPARIEEPARERLRRELGIPAGAAVVGTIGRLVGEKGYREFFEAARRIRRAMPDVVFVAVGDRDPDKTDAITDGEIAEAGGDVIFAGWRNDIPELLSIFDVFVLASWREGMPRSAIEASALGLPLVLTDIPGCRQVASPGVEALFVPPRDPGALVSALTRLLGDKGLAARLATNGRARALKEFDEGAVAHRVSRCTKELLAAKGFDVSEPTLEVPT